MTTLADIAREAQCSVGLVSYVLKKTTPVKSEKHKRILEIAQELDYVPNKMASAMITQRTNNVTLLLGGNYYLNLRQTFFIEYLNALTCLFTERDIGVILYAVADNREEEIKKIVFNSSSDGVIWYMGHVSDNMKQLLAKHQYPSLVVLGQDEVVDYINTDDYGSEYKALQYLYSQNHRRILFGGESNSPRFEAYRDFVRDYGLAYMQQLEMKGSFDYQNRLLMESYLQKNGLDFTAVVFAQDSVAIDTLHYFESKHIRVPQDVSVIGYDDLPESRYTFPPLTTVRQDYEQLARKTVEYMMARIHNKDDRSAVKQTLVQNLVLRNSVARIAPET